MSTNTMSPRSLRAHARRSFLSMVVGVTLSLLVVHYGTQLELRSGYWTGMGIAWIVCAAMVSIPWIVWTNVSDIRRDIHRAARLDALRAARDVTS